MRATTLPCIIAITDTQKRDGVNGVYREDGEKKKTYARHEREEMIEEDGGGGGIVMHTETHVGMHSLCMRFVYAHDAHTINGVLAIIAG